MSVFKTDQQVRGLHGVAGQVATPEVPKVKEEAPKKEGEGDKEDEEEDDEKSPPRECTIVTICFV